jgi:hypothetical protein
MILDKLSDPPAEGDRRPLGGRTTPGKFSTPPRRSANQRRSLFYRAGQDDVAWRTGDFDKSRRAYDKRDWLNPVVTTKFSRAHPSLVADKGLRLLSLAGPNRQDCVLRDAGRGLAQSGARDGATVSRTNSTGNPTRHRTAVPRCLAQIARPMLGDMGAASSRRALILYRSELRLRVDTGTRNRAIFTTASDFPSDLALLVLSGDEARESGLSGSPVAPRNSWLSRWG